MTLGKDLVSDTRARLLQVIKNEAFKRGDFVLASGRRSCYYIDGKMVTLSPEGAYLTGKAVFDEIRHSGAEAVGGLTMGADPIATAVAIASYQERSPIPAFFVRKEPKKHGTRKRIEGPLPTKPGVHVAIVDDVITTGDSVLEAIKVVEEMGCRVCKVVVLVDRLEGGGEVLRERGYDYAPLFTIEQLGVTLDDIRSFERQAQTGLLCR